MSGVGGQPSELMPRDEDGMSRDWCRDSASLLAEECTSSWHLVVTTVVACHDRRAGRCLVVAATRGGRVQITPRPAKQCNVRSNCQCQHDRKYGCSKHVMLEPLLSKNNANRNAASSPTRQPTLHVVNPLSGPAAGFPQPVPKITQSVVTAKSASGLPLATVIRRPCRRSPN